MAINWDGFIMGVGDYAQERLKEERQLKMQERLAELEAKHSAAAEQRKLNLERMRVKGSRDSAGQPGMVEDVNEFGEVLGVRPLDEFTKQQRDQDAQKYMLDQENTRSQIEQRKRALELEAERNSLTRERNSIERQGMRSSSSAESGGGGSGNDAMELVSLVGFKAPTAGDAVGNRNYLRLLGAAENALLWGKSNNMSPENVLQRFRTTALTDGYLED